MTLLFLCFWGKPLYTWLVIKESAEKRPIYCIFKSFSRLFGCLVAWWTEEDTQFSCNFTCFYYVKSCRKTLWYWEIPFWHRYSNAVNIAHIAMGSNLPIRTQENNHGVIGLDCWSNLFIKPWESKVSRLFKLLEEVNRTVIKCCIRSLSNLHSVHKFKPTILSEKV